MRVVTITGEFVNTLPLTAKPGPMAGTTRDNFMRNLFSLASAPGMQADIRVAGQHWDGSGPRAATVRMASDKLSRQDVKRIQGRFADVKPWLGVEPK